MVEISKDEYKRFYDKLGQTRDYSYEYQSRNPLTRYEFQKGLKVLAKIIRSEGTPKTLLDIGCGGGIVAKAISEEFGTTCYGIDISRAAIGKAETTVPNCIFSVADAEELGAKSSTFDVVITSEILEHVLNPERVLKEIKRIMKDTGYAIVSVPMGFGPLQRYIQPVWRKMMGFETLKEGDLEEHMRSYTPAELKRLLGKYFSEIDHKIYPSLPQRQFAVIRK